MYLQALYVCLFLEIKSQMHAANATSKFIADIKFEYKLNSPTYLFPYGKTRRLRISLTDNGTEYSCGDFQNIYK